MTRCQADSSISRVTVDGFAFPLGVAPVEAMKPKPGYICQFEAGDADESGVAGAADGEGEDHPRADAPDDTLDSEGPKWEQWPDRYVFDIVISHDRIEALCRALFSLFPGRIYPILDVLGHDNYREIDPYVSYDLVGLDRFTDHLKRFRDFLFEDGMCGFGAMTEDPFLYVFVDEHKIVTVRAQPDLKDRIEKVLRAFDLEETEEPAGADAASHEHRAVLLTPPDKPEFLSAEEIVEVLRDDWRLVLNVDPDRNDDDEDHELGITFWRCILRCHPPEDAPADPDRRYAEVLLAADSLRTAEEMCLDAAYSLAEDLWPPLEDSQDRTAAAARKPASPPENPHQTPEFGFESDDEPDTDSTPEPDDSLYPRCVIVATDRITPAQFAQVVQRKFRADDQSQNRVFRAGWLDGD